MTVSHKGIWIAVIACVLLALSLFLTIPAIAPAAESSGGSSPSSVVPGSSSENSTQKETDMRSMSLFELLQEYVRQMSSCYYEAYQNRNLNWFSPKLYLQENPDVSLEAQKTSDPGIYALEHYLQTGIFEGRSSCTSFDPAIAIYRSPEAAVHTLSRTGSTPDDLRRAFTSLTGLEDTEGYDLRLENGVLVLVEVDEADSSSGQCDSSAPDPQPVPAQRTATYVTARAMTLGTTFSPYKFYTDKDSATIQTGQISGDNSATVTFYGSNYQKVKTSVKPYTMMIYLTGSDQEMNPAYVRVSSQILSMMKTENLDNVNVILCIGGAPNYNPPYLSEDLKNIGTGIYYLNLSGLTQDQKDTLANTGSEELLEALRKNVTAYDSYFNSDTLVKLATISSIDMGDPALLAGFINFSSQLFPASDYGLSLSNHGGGTLGGICLSASYDTITGTVLHLYELETALSSTDLFRYCDSTGTKDGKLGLLLFDACKMATVEDAYTLKDYYRYMLASEDETTDCTDYYQILTAISRTAATSGTDDRSLVLQLLQGFRNTSWHRGNDSTDGTIAAFSSQEIEKTVEALSTFGESFVHLIDNCVDDTSTYTDDYNLIFTAFRKALLSCNDYCNNSKSQYCVYREQEDSLDFGDFLTYFKGNLEELTISQEHQSLLEEVIQSIDTTLNTGFLINSNMQILNGITILNTDSFSGSVLSVASAKEYQESVWSILHGNSGYYGSSIILPLTMLPNNENYLEQAKYITDFQDSSLSGYIQLLSRYYEYYKKYLNYGDLTSQVNKLSDEMDAVKTNIASIITPKYSGSQCNEKDSITGIEYVTFTVNETYDNTNISAPEDSFGSPMLDILNTTEYIALAIVEDGTNPETELQPVLSLANIDPSMVSPDNNTININLNTLQTSARKYYLKNDDKSTTSSALNLSWYEFYSGTKQAIISLLPDSTGTVSDYLLFCGKATNDQTSESSGAVHVFSKSGVYEGSVVDATGIPFSLLDNIGSIGCYNYVYNATDCKYYLSSADPAVYFPITDVSLAIEYLFDQSAGNGGKNMNDVALALSINNTYFTELAHIDGSSVTPTAAEESANQNNIVEDGADEIIETSSQNNLDNQEDVNETTTPVSEDLPQSEFPDSEDALSSPISEETSVSSETPNACCSAGDLNVPAESDVVGENTEENVIAFDSGFPMESNSSEPADAPIPDIPESDVVGENTEENVIAFDSGFSMESNTSEPADAPIPDSSETNAA